VNHQQIQIRERPRSWRWQSLRSGESTAPPPISIPGFDAMRGLSLLALPSVPRGFSRVTSVPSPQNQHLTSFVLISVNLLSPQSDKKKAEFET